jgi:hypothetical protein
MTPQQYETLVRASIHAARLARTSGFAGWRAVHAYRLDRAAVHRRGLRYALRKQRLAGYALHGQRPPV